MGSLKMRLSKKSNKQKFNSKSQTALEFLTTYAWAFIAILIMIGMLAYFGVLSPSKLFPERCDFGRDFKCEGYTLAYSSSGTDGQVKFKLKNELGYDIQVDSVSVKTEAVAAYDCIITDDGTKWATKGFKDFASTQNCNSQNAQFSKGKKGKVLVALTYHKLGAPTFTHEANGEIFATII